VKLGTPVGDIRLRIATGADCASDLCPGVHIAWPSDREYDVNRSKSETVKGEK